MLNMFIRLLLAIISICTYKHVRIRLYAHAHICTHIRAYTFTFLYISCHVLTRGKRSVLVSWKFLLINFVKKITWDYQHFTSRKYFILCEMYLWEFYLFVYDMVYQETHQWFYWNLFQSIWRRQLQLDLLIPLCARYFRYTLDNPFILIFLKSFKYITRECHISETVDYVFFFFFVGGGSLYHNIWCTCTDCFVTGYCKDS